MSSNIMQQIAALLASQKNANTDAPSTQALERQANVDSLDINLVRNVDAESTRPKLSAQPKLEPAPYNEQDTDKPIASAAAREKQTDSDASLFLTKFMRITITRAPLFIVSTYVPSSRLMFYILHSCNSEAVDNFYLNRAIPGFHPLYMRYYFSVLFFIQTLRAMNNCGLGTAEQRSFRRDFLEVYPPEALSIPGPLLNFFKTLCSSQPAETFYGKVCPLLPEAANPGSPTGFKDSLLPDARYANLLPHVPLILAMMSSMLGSATGASDKGYGYAPISKDDTTSTNSTFGGRTFDCTEKGEWTDNDAWALIAPGIEWPVELDGTQNAAAQARFRRLGFTLPNANADTGTISTFLNLTNLQRFAPFVKMASLYCRFFVGSGTLADCSPDGLQSNQIWSTSIDPDDDAIPTKPTGFYDLDPKHYFSVVHETSRPELPALTETLAYASHSNFVMGTHPYWHQNHRAGPFWNHRPNIGESTDDDSYIGIPDIVSSMHIRGNVIKN
jgi:hypothetical protein